tara:strand:+ start:207 stop:626 length:420 start_codon:yes stop_codon:yes gene_type:complete
MKHICVTHIDAATGIVCTQEPMTTGPKFPVLNGFEYKWANESAWPITCTPEGAYTQAPRLYGVCNDDADTTSTGVLEVLTESDWNDAKAIEMEARRPYPSWILENDVWMPPFLRPADAVINGGTVRYEWDEPTVNWKPL